ncbi:sortase [candidate division KSB1 bacterium]
MALLIPANVYAQSFTDVASNHKSYQAISVLSDLGVVNGYDNGSFQPDKIITRAEAVKLLIASTKPQDFVQDVVRDINQHGQSFVPFNDVDIADWHTPYVVLAKQYGMANGFPDGSFRPFNNISFAEGLKVIMEAYNVDTKRVRFKSSSLLYVNSDDWHARYFAYAYNKNLISKDKFYHPLQWMKRGEFAEILYRLKTVRENGLDQYVETRKPSSNEYTITIPKLGVVNLNVTFADPYNNEKALEVLKNGLGHYLSPPGNGNKLVVFGHSSGYSWDTSDYKWVLRQIDKLKTGDRIYVNYHEKGYVYQINNQEILPADKLNVVMKDYGYEEMALYTCWPPDNISHRYVVYAGRV